MEWDGDFEGFVFRLSIERSIGCGVVAGHPPNRLRLSAGAEEGLVVAVAGSGLPQKAIRRIGRGVLEVPSFFHLEL